MGKYENLGAFLQKQRAQEVPLTFREIEKITGVKLPPKAQHHRAWWSNNPSTTYDEGLAECRLRERSRST